MAPNELAETLIPNSKTNDEAATVSISYDPKLFIQTRISKQSSSIVAGRPYYPNLFVDKNDVLKSIIYTTLHILFHHGNNDVDRLQKDITPTLEVKRVSGGLTNALYQVSGFSRVIDLDFESEYDFDSVLVRVFGAEGIIDRDVETATFAALADNGIAPSYYGRFGNGRLEGFLDNCIPLKLTDFHISETNLEIAVKMAELHAGFKVPSELKEWHNEDEPGLWNQLFSWMEQAKSITVYKTNKDNDRARSLLDLNTMEKELNWIRSIISDESVVGFCHNDLLPANVMKHESSGAVKLIDFEYGGVNFIAFDIANHFNEWAGGPENDEGRTNYDLFPSLEQQKAFISTYVTTISRSNHIDEKKVDLLLNEVKAFVLANHLYWGLWAINQAAIEGTEGFDYFAYGMNRFNRYFEAKNK